MCTSILRIYAFLVPPTVARGVKYTVPRYMRCKGISFYNILGGSICHRDAAGRADMSSCRVSARAVLFFSIKLYSPYDSMKRPMAICYGELRITYSPPGIAPYLFYYVAVCFPFF